MVYLFQNRSVIVHVEGLSDLGQIFPLLQTEFPNYFKDVEGIRILSYRERTILITFLKDFTREKKSIYREHFHEMCKRGKKVLYNHCVITLTTTLPA